MERKKLLKKIEFFYPMPIYYLFIDPTRLPAIIEKDGMAGVEEWKVLVIDLFIYSIKLCSPISYFGNED